MSPSYDYHCQSCGKTFEKTVRVDNRDNISCPDCGAKVDRRLFYPANFQFSPYLKELREGNMLDY